MADVITNKRRCDICGRKVDRWDMASVKKIEYFPGALYNKCSSDIRSRTTSLASLCPTCMEKLEKIIYKHKK